MRKVLITLAAAASAVAVAAPASAQPYGNVTPGYGYGYNNYGYNNYGYGYQNAATLRTQVQQIRYQMRNLTMQGRLTTAERRDMERDIVTAERAIYNANYRGLSPWETQSLQQRVARLQYQLARYSDYDRRNRYNYGWRH
jgi:hypothetical protein